MNSNNVEYIVRDLETHSIWGCESKDEVDDYKSSCDDNRKFAVYKLMKDSEK